MASQPSVLKRLWAWVIWAPKPGPVGEKTKEQNVAIPPSGGVIARIGTVGPGGLGSIGRAVGSGENIVVAGGFRPPPMTISSPPIETQNPARSIPFEGDVGTVGPGPKQLPDRFS